MIISTTGKRLATLGVALLMTACVNDGTDNGDAATVADSFDFSQMFINYADNIIIPNYEAVAASAATFSEQAGPLASYCEAIGGSGEAAALSATGDAWDALQAAIQSTEMHTLGPATENGSALRNRLTFFQTGELSTCGIDQSVVLASEDSNFDVTTRTANQRGIGTVEYLLFNTNLDHTCPGLVNETSDWDSRPDQERKQLRCNYAQLLVADIAAAGDSLVEAWGATGGNYRSTFINVNNTSLSLEALSDAMFYLDVAVKDLKLGVPTGINSECGAFSCPEAVESPYKQTSLQHIRDNLVAFEQMLTGGDGLGFDDLIEAADVAELNTDFAANIALALAALDDIEDSLFDQSSAIDSNDDVAACANAFSNPDSASLFPICNLYGYLKRITDDLKVGFVAAVDVDLPERAQSDND